VIACERYAQAHHFRLFSGFKACPEKMEKMEWMNWMDGKWTNELELP
jgi:hypothetical protein